MEPEVAAAEDFEGFKDTLDDLEEDGPTANGLTCASYVFIQLLHTS